MLLKKTFFFAWLMSFVCYIYSLTLPYYTNPKAVSDAIAEINPDKNLYYQKVEEFRTIKIALMDFGSGIFMFSLTILIFMQFMKIESISDCKVLNTCSRRNLFIGSNIAGFMMIPASIWYYPFRLSRGDYPPFADSIGIPLAASMMVNFLIILFLNLFLIALTTKSNLPEKLFLWPKIHTFHSILCELFFSLLLLINLMTLIALIFDGDHIMIPINLYFIYMILVLRANKIGKS